VRRWKQLEDENAKLKKLVADLSLDKEMPQDVIRRKTVKPGRKRKLVDEMRSEWQVSIRRACEALEFDRPPYHYKSRRSGQAALEHRIKEICHIRVRYGYPRIDILLRREGGPSTRKRRAASVANWACNCATKRRNVGLKPSCAMVADGRRDGTRAGPWS